MYKNVGENIKILAMAYAALLALGSVVTGIILLISENWFGLLFIFAGPFVAWVTSLPLYGFGQLVTNSDLIAGEHIKGAEISCPFCGESIKLKRKDFEAAETAICPSCGKRFEY